MFSKKTDGVRARACRNMLTVVLILVGTSVLAAQDGENVQRPRKIAVITNLSNPTAQMSKAQLGRAFLKKYKFWDSGLRCIPIDQSGTSEIRTAFYDQVLNRDQEALKRHWMQETMTGNARPPVTVENSLTVKKYIEKLEGGVGYIWADEIDESVKVVLITDDPRFEVPSSSPRNAEESVAGEEP